ncbi:MAG: hypothetical protein HY721_31760 [Planctomycetes bacterium]|nr:hypothetical protein [Planctomycetota bacterium]
MPCSAAAGYGGLNPKKKGTTTFRWLMIAMGSVRTLAPYPDLDGDGVFELAASVSHVGLRVISPTTGENLLLLEGVDNSGRAHETD